MRRRAVGGTGVELTELAFGGAAIGNLYHATTDADTEEAIEVAWQAGVRYFDTAPHYGLGLSESRLGMALAGRRRDDYILSTKVGRLLVPDPGGSGGLNDEGFAVPATLRRMWDFSQDGVRRSLESSLQRLGVDRLDVVLIHDPDDHWEVASREAFPALAELRSQGVVRAIGVGMNQSAMLARFVRETDVDLIMLAGRYTLLDQRALDDLLPAALERGVCVVAAGVFNSGLLAQHRPSLDAMYNYGKAPSDLVERANRIAGICARYGATLPAAAMHFPLAHPAVASVVVGVRDGGEMRQNAALYARHLPGQLWEDLVAEELIRHDTPR